MLILYLFSTTTYPAAPRAVTYSNKEASPPFWRRGLQGAAQPAKSRRERSEAPSAAAAAAAHREFRQSLSRRHSPPPLTASPSLQQANSALKPSPLAAASAMADDLTFDFERTLTDYGAGGMQVSTGLGRGGGGRQAAAARFGSPFLPPFSLAPASLAHTRPSFSPLQAGGAGPGGRGGASSDLAADGGPKPRNYRQTVCTYWLRGLCMKGDTCGFLHQFDPERMPVCRSLLKFGQCKEPGGSSGWQLGGRIARVGLTASCAAAPACCGQQQQRGYDCSMPALPLAAPAHWQHFAAPALTLVLRTHAAPFPSHLCTPPRADCPYKHTLEAIKECNMYKLGFCIYGPAVSL